MYVTCDAFPAAIATIPKAGSQSIEQAVMVMRNGQRITNDSALQNHTQRILFLRKPWSRIVSFYSFMWWNRYNGYNISDFLPDNILSGEFGNEEKDYKDFIDYILINEHNYWGSQIEQVTHNSIFTPTKVLKFEDLQEYWPSVAQGRIPTREVNDVNMPWQNAWTKKAECEQFKSYRKEELLVIHKIDNDLWKTL